MQTLNVDLHAGSIVGEYQIKRLLGHGQSGAAYLAQHLAQGCTVMITIFNFPEEISAQQHNRLSAHLIQERAILVSFTHPNILPIYDFGEQAGSLYLVTAFVKGASLGQVLKQQGRFTPHQTLEILKQLAAGLDFAHSKGAVHGILSLSNTLMSNGLTVQIAGFGLRTMLEVHGNRGKTLSQAFLYSTSGTFLGSPAYISPERVLGKPVDARSDMYALGIMLFEMLSGTLPFSGANPLEIALKRIQQPVPSVHALCPDVPEALDLVISKALDSDPAKRYQRAGDCAATFDRALRLLEVSERSSTLGALQLAQSSQLTLPPTVNWFDEVGMPLVTPSSSSENALRLATGSGQMHPSAAVHPNSPTEQVPATGAFPFPAGNSPDSMAGIDPFAWWSATSTRPGTPSQTPGTFTQRSPVRQAHSNPRSRRHPAKLNRRKLLKLMAVGTVGALTVSGISFAYFMQSLKPSPSGTAHAPTAGSTTSTTTIGNTPPVGSTSTISATSTTVTTKGTHNTPTPSTSPTARAMPTAQPTQQPTPKPTQPPPPTPTPGHTGTVIGSTNQSTNSSKSFTNPADGQGCLLIRLSNGNFVACERACTHAQVPVDYDAGSGQLVCPAHGAIFDPTHGFSHTSGPGNGPLAAVSIHVNADGTITTG